MRLLAVVGLLVLAGCGHADARPRILKLKVKSEAVGRTLPLRVVVPEGGGEGRPLLVFLHGRGAGVESSIDDRFLAALDKLGDRAPVVAFPDGGDHSYWHNRASGKWGRYVLHEVIPQVLDRTGADGDRVALGGISMGGFGAIDLATRAKRHFCAVGGHSPAIWQTAGETAPGAFDDAADFERHDVIERAGRLEGTVVRVDIGRSDPFLPGVTAFADAAGVKLHLGDGGHEGAYWHRHMPQYVRFYARSCA